MRAASDAGIQLGGAQPGDAIAPESARDGVRLPSVRDAQRNTRPGRQPQHHHYFAEGSTANGFEEYLTMLNPSGTAVAHVTATFYSRPGGVIGTRATTIGPMHRGNVKVND